MRYWMTEISLRDDGVDCFRRLFDCSATAWRTGGVTDAFLSCSLQLWCTILYQYQFDENSVNCCLYYIDYGSVRPTWIMLGRRRFGGSENNKKLSYRRETARQLHMTTWAGQLTF